MCSLIFLSILLTVVHNKDFANFLRLYWISKLNLKSKLIVYFCIIRNKTIFFANFFIIVKNNLLTFFRSYYIGNFSINFYRRSNELTITLMFFANSCSIMNKKVLISFFSQKDKIVINIYNISTIIFRTIFFTVIYNTPISIKRKLFVNLFWSMYIAIPAIAGL